MSAKDAGVEPVCSACCSEVTKFGRASTMEMEGIVEIVGKHSLPRRDIAVTVRGSQQLMVSVQREVQYQVIGSR